MPTRERYYEQKKNIANIKIFRLSLFQTPCLESACVTDRYVCVPHYEMGDFSCVCAEGYSGQLCLPEGGAVVPNEGLPPMPTELPPMPTE